MLDPIRYPELLTRNAALAGVAGPSCRIAVLANITVAPIREILEFSLRSRGVAATVTLGDYDNVAADSEKYRDHDVVVIFFELAGIADRLPFELYRLDAATVATLVEKARRELAFVFDALGSSRLVLFNLLTALPFTSGSPLPSALDGLCDEVNAFVRAHAPASFRLVEIGKILARNSIHACIDLRFYLCGRALYRLEFLRSYAEFVYPMIGASVGHYKKVLAFDCDNTLWRGIVGEDGREAVQPWTEIQSLAVHLSQSGVLLCLCSKNDPEDVDAMLLDPRMVLRDEHLIVKAVNWQDKAENLAHIAEVLNVGLDSLVFLDDSDFELNIVRQRLPSVTTFKVPQSYPEYLWLFQQVASLFYREGLTAEDRSKAAQYRTEFARREQRTRFGDIDTYLASLELTVKLCLNCASLVPRLAQLTQKTNQFNLTTRRLTDAQLAVMTAGSENLVVGIDVADKYGTYGVVGLIVARQSACEAHIDHFLLSCRVIGRHIEFKVFDAVVALLRRRGVRKVCGRYRSTGKNAQVRDLYGTLGFSVVAEDDAERSFELDIDSYKDRGDDYIGIEES